MVMILCTNISYSIYSQTYTYLFDPTKIGRQTDRQTIYEEYTLDINHIYV